MDLSEFDYHLPPERIAQSPLEQRDRSRLLVVNRKTGQMHDPIFCTAHEWLDPGDLLVLNDTYVFPARLLGQKEPGGAAIEMLLLESLGNRVWEVIAYRASRLKKGTHVKFADDFHCTVLESIGEGKFHVQFTWQGEWDEVLSRYGHIPLPPYIVRDHDQETSMDKERYQTIFAKKHPPYDSAAAPTASLHFTQSTLDQFTNKGIELAYVTLRIGLDTFLPIRSETIEDHTIHSETYVVSPETAEKVNQTLAKGKRVVAVGTTVVRTLESAAVDTNKVQPGEARSTLFIYPGYEFKIVSSMFTNFHLPKTTLLLLISAFMGNDLRQKAYDYAIQNRFRFYSYGDSMLIL